MPKTGGNGRSTGYPGWFLFSVSDSFFKRAWANTKYPEFDSVKVPRTGVTIGVCVGGR